MLSPLIIPMATLTGPQSNNATVQVPEGLKNPDQEPMYLDEIRFLVDTSTGTNPSEFLPDALRTQIKIGREPITDGYVPLALMCEPHDWLAGSAADTSTHKVGYRFFFPQPVVVPPRAIVSLGFGLFNDLAAALPSLYKIDAALVGRAMPKDSKLPITTRAPFVSGWLSNTIAGGSTLTQKSLITDIKNPLPVELRVERLSSYVVSKGSAFFAMSMFDDQAAMQAAQVRLYARTGPLGVRDLDPAGSLVLYGRRSWSWKTRLPPGGYYVADVSYAALTGTTISRIGVAIIGDREVNTVSLEER